MYKGICVKGLKVLDTKKLNKAEKIHSIELGYKINSTITIRTYQ